MMETGRSRIGKPRTRLGMSTGGRARSNRIFFCNNQIVYFFSFRRPGNPNVVANCFDHEGYPYAIVINKGKQNLLFPQKIKSLNLYYTFNSKLKF